MSCIERDSNPYNLINRDSHWVEVLNNMKIDALREAHDLIKIVADLTDNIQNEKKKKQKELGSEELIQNLENILDYKEPTQKNIAKYLSKKCFEQEFNNKNIINHNIINLVTAESLTAGMIMSTLVDVPTCGFLKYGCIGVYDTDAKRKFLEVSVIELYSPNCAIQMAISALEKSNAIVSIAVTGNAAPSLDKNSRLGETFIAVAAYCKGSNDNIVIKYTYRPINGCVGQTGYNIYDKCLEWVAITDQGDYASTSDTAIVMQGVRMIVVQESYKLASQFLLMIKDEITVPDFIIYKRILNSIQFSMLDKSELFKFIGVDENSSPNPPAPELSLEALKEQRKKKYLNVICFKTKVPDKYLHLYKKNTDIPEQDFVAVDVLKSLEFKNHINTKERNDLPVVFRLEVTNKGAVTPPASEQVKQPKALRVTRSATEAIHLPRGGKINRNKITIKDVKSGKVTNKKITIRKKQNKNIPSSFKKKM